VSFLYYNICSQYWVYSIKDNLLNFKKKKEEDTEGYNIVLFKILGLLKVHRGHYGYRKKSEAGGLFTSCYLIMLFKISTYTMYLLSLIHFWCYLFCWRFIVGLCYLLYRPLDCHLLPTLVIINIISMNTFLTNVIILLWFVKCNKKHNRRDKDTITWILSLNVIALMNAPPLTSAVHNKWAFVLCSSVTWLGRG